MAIFNSHAKSPKGRFFTSTWWIIPLCKQVISPVISGISRITPLITRVIAYLLSGMIHQVVILPQSHFEATAGSIGMIPSGNDQQFANLKPWPSRKFVDFPMNCMVMILISLLCTHLPEGVSIQSFPFSYNENTNTYTINGHFTYLNSRYLPYTKPIVHA